MSREARLYVAKKALIDFLARKRPPHGLSTDQQADEIKDLADALVRKIVVQSDEAFTDAVAQTIRTLRDTVDSHFWPTQAALLAAVPAQPVNAAAPATFELDEYQHAADRMSRGIPVSDHIVFGRLGEELLANGDISPATLDAYRLGMVRAFVDLHGRDARRHVIGRYGLRAMRYLDELGVPDPSEPRIRDLPPAPTDPDQLPATARSIDPDANSRPFGGRPDEGELRKAHAGNILNAATRAYHAHREKNGDKR